MQHALSFSSLIAPGSAGIDRERVARQSREPEETSFGSIMAEQRRAAKEEEAVADPRPVAQKKDDRRVEPKEAKAEPAPDDARDSENACAPAQQPPAEARPAAGEAEQTAETADGETAEASPGAEDDTAGQPEAGAQPGAVEVPIPLPAGAAQEAAASVAAGETVALEVPLDEALKGATDAAKAKQIRAQEPQSTPAAPSIHLRPEGAAMPAAVNAPMAEAVRRVSSDVASARLEANITAREARTESLPVVPRVSPAQFAFSAFISSDEMMAALPEQSTSDTQTELSELSEVSDEFARAVERGGSFRATETATGLTQGARVFRPAAAALAERVSASPSGEVDVRLSPEELGNLRISFTQDDSGLNVVIRADRADTLELLRRHINQFTQDLREQGFEEVTISFGDHGGAATSGGWAETEASTGAAAPRFNDAPGAQLAAQPAAPTPKVTNGGLDLRL